MSPWLGGLGENSPRLPTSNKSVLSFIFNGLLIFLFFLTQNPRLTSTGKKIDLMVEYFALMNICCLLQLSFHFS